MTEPIISAHNLSKSFYLRSQRKGMIGAIRSLADRGGTQVAAVNDISLDIATGEVVGYIGPNGAGKSTTIKMLTGILVPTSGTATVSGFTPWKERRQLAARIGVVFGQRTQLWWDLPLSESLELLRFIYRVPKQEFDRMYRVAIELLDLGPFLETPVRQLSLGQRMRGDLAAALLHEPPILYLDEPTIGLDLVAKTRIRDFLAERNRETGVTIMLTTHDLADIERLCQRIVVIDRGCIVHDGSLDRLRDRFATSRQLTIDFDETPDLAIHDVAPGLDIVSQTGPRLRLAFDRRQYTAPAAIALMGRIGAIRDISIEEPAIEDIVRNLYASAPVDD